MLGAILYILFGAANDRFRGWSPKGEKKDYTILQRFLSAITGKIFFTPLYQAIATYAYAGNCWIMAIVGIGWQIGVVYGTGDYHDGTDKLNNEVKWIDDLVIKILPSGFWNDLVSMGIRNFAYFAPTFIALGLYQHDASTMLLSLPMLLVGFLYLFPRKYLGAERGHVVAELSRGLLFASLIVEAL
jgi:hypothetical protein